MFRKPLIKKPTTSSLNPEKTTGLVEPLDEGKEESLAGGLRLANLDSNNQVTYGLSQWDHPFLFYRVR